MNTITGGCMCGAIRYQTDADLRFTFHCQCRQCQHITGTGHASQFAVPRELVTLTGEPRYYDLKADSGNTVRSGFCPTCGNPILKTTSGYPDTLFIHAATLDDPSQFKPKKLAYTSTAQPWDYMDPALEVLNYD